MKSGSARRRVTGVTGLLVAILVLGSAGASAKNQEEAPNSGLATRFLSADWRVVLGGTVTVFDTGAAWSPRGLAGGVIDLEYRSEKDGEILGVRYRFNYAAAYASLAF